MAHPVLRTASFGRRAAGSFLDGLILSVLAAPAYVLFGRAAWGWAWFVLHATITIVGTAGWGQTPGKRIVGTRVVSDVSTSLDPPGWGSAVIRFLVLSGPSLIPRIGGVVSSIIFVVALIGVAVDERRRGIHDHAAGTRVVEAE